ncbi:MAG TPA: NAD-dependent epimerase/dehydratase family protein [Gemmatimonadaceae bacterium]|nr:NAD-dependent epimerase/dehydratase family protein [Gemmatimonadaceae bacterium]
MKILVTGGTGLIGESTVRELLRRGHTVRVLSRHAGRDEPWLPASVETWRGDVAEERTLEGAADGCDAILHVAGIIDEAPPARTFQRVNIEGTRYVVLEAERAGVRKIVYVSSLGAERGASPYHKSKSVAEDVVRAFTRDWVVVRPGAVYGPGDEHISRMLRLVRSMPVVPTIGDGNQPFQPIWHEDLARALAIAIERDDLRCVSLDVAGTEITSQNDLVSRFRTLTGRDVPQAALPDVIASWGVRVLDTLGVDAPLNESQLAMLAEGNVIPAGRSNALTDAFGVAPTKLADGLRRLVDDQPEQLPDQGVGALERQRYWVDVRGARLDADQLYDYIRNQFPSLMPPIVRVIDPERVRIAEGETITLELPLRGQMQVRVAEVMDRRITLLTVVGHPIAGAVRFLVEPRGDALRFEIQVYDRPASTFDALMLRTVGRWAQRGVWIEFARNVAAAAGGTAADIQRDDATLDEREAALVNEWASALSAQLSRNATSSGRD